MKQWIIQKGPVYNDNYVYFVQKPDSNEVVVFDPPTFEDVDGWIEDNHWNLRGIYNTHHHHDHVGGIVPLKNKYKCPVWGPLYDKMRTSGIDHYLSDGEAVKIFGFTGEVKLLKGHTQSLLGYWFKESAILFASDILFSMGCGRMFEGSPEDLWTSLQWIRNLPEDTWIYCAHEYSLINGKFALTLEPTNQDLIHRMAQVNEQLSSGQATVPTQLKMEKSTNPFLRPESKEIKEALGLSPSTDPVRIIKVMRAKKDHF